MCMLLRIAGADFAVGLAFRGLKYSGRELFPGDMVSDSISSGPGFETLMGHCVLFLSTTH